LNLAKNVLEGEIPLALRNCSQLMFPNVANNRLNGSRLTDIGRPAQLESLVASGNQLVGEIPANITAVSALVLGNNGSQGKIPSKIGNLKALQILDLSNMRLDSGIPSGLGGCIALQKL
jgi:Leucine-rich repeat (LRR) protein